MGEAEYDDEIEDSVLEELKKQYLARHRIRHGKISTLVHLLFLCVVALFILIFSGVVHFLISTSVVPELRLQPANQILIYIASWVALLAISVLASMQIREIINKSSYNVFRRRANVIAIMIGLVLTIFLFKQPYLEQLFASYSPEGVLKIILFTGGVGSGWIVWYLKHLKKYGDFFNVFLHTIIIGFCWYARLTAPEQVQLTAVAFLLGSLFHIAKDYLDRADKAEPIFKQSTKFNSREQRRRS